MSVGQAVPKRPITPSIGGRPGPSVGAAKRAPVETLTLRGQIDDAASKLAELRRRADDAPDGVAAAVDDADAALDRAISRLDERDELDEGSDDPDVGPDAARWEPDERSKP